MFDIVLILFIGTSTGMINGISPAFTDFITDDTIWFLMSSLALLVLINLLIPVRRHLSNFQIAFFAVACLSYSVATLIMIVTFRTF